MDELRRYSEMETNLIKGLYQNPKGIWYLEKGILGTRLAKSLKTTNREEAIVAAKKLVVDTVDLLSVKEEPTVSIDDISLYAYCPYYYKYKGRRTVNYIEDIIRKAIAHVWKIKGTGHSSNIRHFETMLSRLQKDNDVIITPSYRNKMRNIITTINRHFGKCSVEAIDTEINMYGVKVLVDLVLKTSSETKYIIYDFGDTRPHEQKINNSLKTTIINSHLHDTLKGRWKLYIVWSDQLLEPARNYVNNAYYLFKRLTKDVNDDIIYKRTGLWCVERCTFRSQCGR